AEVSRGRRRANPWHGTSNARHDRVAHSCVVADRPHQPAAAWTAANAEAGDAADAEGARRLRHPFADGAGLPAAGTDRAARSGSRAAQAEPCGPGVHDSGSGVWSAERGAPAVRSGTSAAKLRSAAAVPATGIPGVRRASPGDRRAGSGSAAGVRPAAHRGAAAGVRASAHVLWAAADVLLLRSAILAALLGLTRWSGGREKASLHGEAFSLCCCCA